MAKNMYVVAATTDTIPSMKKPSIVLGKFRKVEFARKARQRMRGEASKRGISYIGLFLDGKFIEDL